MTIKDVEELTGITRQNIRFYEREGLITPRRNPENQYREYSEEDVRALNQIRLYRKLDVSIEDIRNLKNRALSLENCMEKCISNMEKEMARMTKMKEVCEEVKRMGEEGLAPVVEQTLQQIDVYEKSGYHFADISKDYWDQKLVEEIRSVNRQVGIVLFWSVAASIFYLILQQPRWLLLLSAAPLAVRTALWLLWGRENPAIVKKHIRFSHVPAAVWFAAAAVGFLLYPIILGSVSLASLIRPTGTEGAIAYSTGEFLWIGVFHVLDTVCHTVVFCILFYDTYRQKSAISALCLSSLLFVLLHLNPRAAGMHELIPWTLLAFALIFILLAFTGRKMEKKIDWRLEWEKERSFCMETAREAVIMDQKAYREIEKKRRKSYRLLDGYLAAVIVTAFWITVIWL